MYTEEYERKGFPFRKFIIRLIIIVIIALGGIYAFSKFYPNKAKNNTSTKKCVARSKITETKTKENIREVKEIALQYFKKDNLPAKTNQDVTITFKELKKIDLLEDVYDERGIAYYDVSYVKLLKQKDGYILYISLQTRDDELCVYIKVNHFDTCENYLCEKSEKKKNNQTTPESTTDENKKEEKTTETSEEDKPIEAPITVPNTSTSDKYDNIIESEEIYQGK